MTHMPVETEVDRPLTSEEHDLIHWLLEHGDGGYREFLEQLGEARVVRLCSCGCASVDLAISGKRPMQHAMRVLSDFQWRDDRGHLCGAFVFEQDGLLAGLELWSIDGQCTPEALPPVERLVPFGSAES